MKGRAFLFILLLPLVGAAVGYSAGPFLARYDDTVQVAARLALEESEDLTEMTLESEAFRDTGRPVEELYADARGVIGRFRLGGALLGAWCGLVVGLKLAGQARIPTREIYDIDHSLCVSCARCFLNCPREHLRLKELGIEREVAPRLLTGGRLSCRQGTRGLSPLPRSVTNVLSQIGRSLVVGSTPWSDAVNRGDSA